MSSVAKGLATSIQETTNFNVQQSLLNGPHSFALPVVNDTEANVDNEAKSKCAEDCGPLLAHDQIMFNSSSNDNRSSSSDNDQNSRNKTDAMQKSSKEKDSPEKYLSCGQYLCRSKYGHRQADIYKESNKCGSHSPLPVEKKSFDKLPYYRDKQREKDRLRCSRSSALSYERTSRHCLASRERCSRRSPYRNVKRTHSIRRSRTPSKKRSSTKRECHKDTSKDPERERKSLCSSATEAFSSTPQYIPIPVAAYPFPGWPFAQPSWHTAPRLPPASQFAAFHMWPIAHPTRTPHQPSYVDMPPSLPYAAMRTQSRPHTSHIAAGHNIRNH